jgi:hypothetical protein
MADYVQDPDDPKKQVPAPSTHRSYMAQPNTSFIGVFDTTTELEAGKATPGSMAFVLADKKSHTTRCSFTSF